MSSQADFANHCFSHKDTESLIIRQKCSINEQGTGISIRVIRGGRYQANIAYTILNNFTRMSDSPVFSIAPII